MLRELWKTRAEVFTYVRGAQDSIKDVKRPVQLSVIDAHLKIEINWHFAGHRRQRLELVSLPCMYVCTYIYVYIYIYILIYLFIFI